MSDKSNSAASGGIGFTGLLAIVFITLKLCHVIDWSWWWVLAPIWLPVGTGLVIFGTFLLVVWIWLGLKPKRGNR